MAYGPLRSGSDQEVAGSTPSAAQSFAQSVTNWSISVEDRELVKCEVECLLCTVARDKHFRRVGVGEEVGCRKNVTLTGVIPRR